MSLKEPHLKMSKSHQDELSRIMLNDDDATIVLKIRKALTDSVTGISYDPVQRPALSSLIMLLHHLENEKRSPKEIADENKSLSMRAFKEFLADALCAKTRPIREAYAYLEAPERSQYLKDVERKGNESAKVSAASTMQRVRSAVGFSD
jgi:tryptophanyl-tRNA synthetase